MNRSRRIRGPVVLVCAAALFMTGMTASAQAEGFSISDPKATTLSGVSPFVLQVDAQVDRVFYGGGTSGWQMAECAQSGACTSTSLSFAFGMDYTSVTLSDGSNRAYFVSMTPDGTKEITSAAVNYGPGIPVLGPATPLGLKSAPQQRAWGVPDSVVLPDGRVRLYWVDVNASAPDPSMGVFTPTKKQRTCIAKKISRPKLAKIAQGAKPTPAQVKVFALCGVDFGATAGRGASPEVIVSATSTDARGTSFVKDPGFRFTGGYVDSDVIQAENGNWIALVSTGPGAPPQRLYAATSPDGLIWKVLGQALTPAGVNVLDPTAYKIGPNSWRLYYAQSPKETPFENHSIIRATLTR